MTLKAKYQAYLKSIVTCSNEACSTWGPITPEWMQFKDGQVWCPRCCKGAEIILEKIFGVESVKDIKYDPARDERVNHG